jgi:hypothetical protein
VGVLVMVLVTTNGVALTVDVSVFVSVIAVERVGVGVPFLSGA